jgi:Secretion system C-terminal sorting domain
MIAGSIACSLCHAAATAASRQGASFPGCGKGAPKAPRGVHAAAGHRPVRHRLCLQECLIQKKRTMKKIILSILLLASCLSSPAQRELWGINLGIWDTDPNSTAYMGNITKYDIHGLNAKVMHEFKEFETGRTPMGAQVLASNGKLYGTTLAGGLVDPYFPSHNGYGVLYEYDLTLNKYRVVHRFTGPGNPYNALTEPMPGKLFGSFGYWSSGGFYTYDLDSDSLSILPNLPMLWYWVFLGQNTPMKASDGHWYMATGYKSECPQGSTLPFNGSIIDVDPAANTLEIAFTLKCDGTDGIIGLFSLGTFIESKTEPGKLWGVASGGWPNTPLEHGYVFEFDIGTRAFTPKAMFDGDSLGKWPLMMIDGGEGKLYGVCWRGGSNVSIGNDGDTVVERYGTLFEYTPATNELRKLHDFGPSERPPYVWSGTNPYFFMKTSTGDYLGLTDMGLFRFNPADTTVVYIPYCSPCPEPNAYVTESFIEICRKPSYREFAEDTVRRCTGSAFSLDLQSDNAVGYAWEKDGAALPGQTTGVLSLDSLRAADSGTYTCTMDNECGTTTTMSLLLRVETCVGLDALVPLDEALAVYPNPTQDVLHIRVRENSYLEIGTLTVTNLLGQTVLTEEGGTTTIDVGKLTPGLYQLKLSTSQGTWNGKFIKK